MTLPLDYPYPPMEAESAAALPNGDAWLYEPKWDGFRCLAFKDKDTVRIQSKAGKPLGRYFPDVVAAVEALEAKQFVLDGEIVIPVNGRLSFDELLLRVHPAESRVRTLVAANPARLVVFDLLVDDRGKSLVDLTLAERRPRLESFAKKYFPPSGSVILSHVTHNLAIAQSWLEGGGKGDLDGVIAKRLDYPYRSGERDGMRKVKRQRTADCVVGGFRYASKGGGVGSLLLGLYDDDGLLHHVGFTSSLRADERKGLTEKLERLVQPPGFTGKAPGGPSRWSTERTGEWEPLAPKLVVEVGYDHVSGGRFRHGTKFLRWRPDKAPEQCTMDQLGR
jgi:ATP-dependent DNA ligase